MSRSHGIRRTRGDSRYLEFTPKSNGLWRADLVTCPACDASPERTEEDADLSDERVFAHLLREHGPEDFPVSGGDRR